MSWVGGTVSGMETTTQRPTYDITVDWKLLDHYDHLPETIECICGYVREDAA